MKQIELIYAYDPSIGVVGHRVLEHRTGHLVRESGFTGERLRLSDLDAPSSRYFTTARGAIEAFISKAEAALADKSRAAHHAGWRKALTHARRELRKSR